LLNRQTKQVWSQCGDVRIKHSKNEESHAVAEPPAAAAAATAAAAAAAAARTPVCVGESLGLATADCTAWVDLYDALNGPHWIGGDAVRKNAILGPLYTTQMIKMIFLTRQARDEHRKSYT
jgi:hypothetical protein